MKNYFKTHEIVPWAVFKLLGENARNLVSGRLLYVMNLLRAELGKSMLCNTAGEGGREQSCLRVPGQSHYRPTSQHSGNHAHSIDGNKCTAMDTVGDWDPRELHAIILKQPEKYKAIRFIEVDISWLHIDVRDTPALRVWSPKRGFIEVEAYIEELKEAGFW